MTTAQSFPLTPIDVMFAAVMALKAYSGIIGSVKLIQNACGGWCQRTDLVEAALVGEDGDVSVETCAA